MAEYVRQIPEGVHESLTDLSVGEEFELFGEKFVLVECEKDQDDNGIMYDCIAQKVGEDRYFSFFYYYSTYGYEDHGYEPTQQDFSFTEVEKKIVPVVRWSKKK